MKLRLQRLPQCADCTLGGLAINDRFECFTLEDVHRDVKVPGQTRIPPGVYLIKLRTEGAMHTKFLGLYPEHRGMLWLQDVPGFEWVYLHPGNSQLDTDGCILTGDAALATGRVTESVIAYRRLYGVVTNAILAGEPVTIAIGD